MSYGAREEAVERWILNYEVKKNDTEAKVVKKMCDTFVFLNVSEARDILRQFMKEEGRCL